MIFDPNKDPRIIAARKLLSEGEAKARAKAEQLKQDHELGRAKGQAPEQIEARRRVAKVFFESHMPAGKPEAVEAFIATIDLKEPVVSMNARGVDLQNPRSRGFMGMGRKPAYLISKQVPPKTETDPIYALEYYPLKG